MNDHIHKLIESLREGKYEDPTEKIALLGAALRENGGAELPLILSLLRAPQIPLRVAALEGARDRQEPELVEEIRKLADDPDWRVRRKLAQIVPGLPPVPFRELLRRLAEDDDLNVRMAAVKSSAGHPDFFDVQRQLLADDPSYSVREEAAEALGRQQIHAVVTDLFIALAQDDDDDVQRKCAEHVEKRLVKSRDAVIGLLPTAIALLEKAEAALKALGTRRFPELVEYVSTRTTVEVNPAELASFGTELTALARKGVLPRGRCLDKQRDALLQLLLRKGARPVALLGPSGAGKSVLVNEVAYELMKPENGGWHVLRVSPADIMAGTKYLGEWETRVRALIDAARRPRRVLLYVPNLGDLSSVGRFSKSDFNVAAALAPYLEDGSILLLGESTPEEFQRGLGREQSLQRLFEKVLMPESDRDQTREVLRAIRDAAHCPMSDATLDQLLELSDQFLGNVARPGNAAGLLALIAGATDGASPIALRTILEALSKSTGIPTDLLDDAVPLDLAGVRGFFEKRVMGQPEAVDAVIDLVTLIKAGLTDPNKPMGVFLFVGPTGVGKTELARALAEYIFGDAARLQRFDMSEFASREGFERLIGIGEQKGSLTDAVRQHPFSVVLLDEIEKAHVNVFDLCLQLFDAGRLTDGHGRTVDFRRTIVILTSNVGALAPTTATLGFNAANAPALPDVDKDRVFRELSRCFRPEFLNRIDRIINFRPLSLEVAENIARREINLVLQRSGLLRRELVVDVDPSALTLLVREGYSPHFGARPLKRAVERLVLLPLARIIAGGRISNRAVLHLRQGHGRLDVTITSAPAARSIAAPRPAPGESLRDTARQLSDELTGLDQKVRALADRKSELLAKTHDASFYRDPQSRSETFDEIHKLDQFLALQDGLRTALANVHQRLVERPLTKSQEPAIADRLEQLAAEVAQVRFIAGSRDALDMSDVLISVALVDRSGERQDCVEKLAWMYSGLAKRRRMTAEIQAERFDDTTDEACLQISGLGAYVLLKHETGLHQFDRRFRTKATRTHREKEHEDREIVRVKVIPLRHEPDKAFVREVKAGVQPLKPVRSRLLKKAELDISLFHEPSLRSLQAWTNGPKTEAVARLQRILHAMINAGTHDDANATTLVRSYDLGIAPKIKDFRTGRTTTHIDQVLKGNLDVFLQP